MLTFGTTKIWAAAWLEAMKAMKAMKKSVIAKGTLEMVQGFGKPWPDSEQGPRIRLLRFCCLPLLKCLVHFRDAKIYLVHSQVEVLLSDWKD